MKTYLLSLMMVFLILTPLASEGAETTKWGDLKFLTTDQFKEMYDAKDDFVSINALSPIEFAEIRIAGSINVPFENLKSGEGRLPADKEKKLVFYCKGHK
jgi:hypothetical protein